MRAQMALAQDCANTDVHATWVQLGRCADVIESVELRNRLLEKEIDCRVEDDVDFLVDAIDLPEASTLLRGIRLAPPPDIPFARVVTRNE